MRTEEQKERKRKYERIWYKTKGKEKRKRANDRWEQKNVEAYKNIKLQLKCSRCPENHIVCLEFHHKNSADKSGNVSSMMRRWSPKRLKKEMDKCEILCSNCHRKEHYKAEQT